MVNHPHNGSKTGITLIGLGPGDPGLITLQAWEWLNKIDRLYLRTFHHPCVAYLPKHLKIFSFDKFYEQYDDFTMVYEAIITQILELGSTTAVTYAVPGNPFVAETTCPEIVKRAKVAGIPVFVIDGLSFLEPTFRVLNIDPFSGLMLSDAIEISQRLTPGFPPTSPVLIAQIYDRFVAAEVKLTLMSAYPDEHTVQLVHAAGTAEQLVETLPLHAIDKSQNLGLLSSLYIPALSPHASFEAFQEVIAKLRAPNGCPWDRQQTHMSLRPYLLEEAYETLEALDDENMVELEEEFGDLLLQIVLHAQIATETGDFNMQNVIEGISKKLIRRHPHIFSGTKVLDVEGVIHNWEQIKAEERQLNGDVKKKGILDGVPKALPALSQAEKIIDRVGRVGFKKLTHIETSKVLLDDLDIYQEAQGETARIEALGELLLAVSALAFKEGIDAESALRKTLTKFRIRFGKMEAAAGAQGKTLIDLTSEELDTLWDLAAHQNSTEAG